jgi:predicted porin
MKKKVMAVAVAGVLAAPALAFAQASTVQIYGYLNAEYGFAKGVNKAAGKTNNWDGLNSSASYIGFKGEEKLGGGMSAFFQCETDVGFLKGDQTVGAAGGHPATQGGWCSRNSAVGLKGGYGSVYIGTWDSPTKRLVSGSRILGETGWHGVQAFLLSNAGAFTGTYSARNSNSVNYDSPNFNGFSMSAQLTSTKEAATVTTAGLKGRSNSMSLNYAGGPFTAAVAYTAQDDNRSASGVQGTTDKAWAIGGTYVWNAFKVGVTYVDASSEPTTTSELKRASWNLAGTWNFSGPHSAVLGYTVAGDTKFSGAGAAPAATGNDTGAYQFTIGYQNALSKRTKASLTYMRADNDSRATGYSVGNAHATGMVAGSSSSVFATRLEHSF